VRLSIVFNTIIWISVDPEILSAPNKTGICRKKNKRAEMIRGLNIFFDSAESLLNTNPVESTCSIPAATTVDRIHIIDVEEIVNTGKGKPLVIRVRKAVPTNNSPIPRPKKTSNTMFFLENPSPFRKFVFSILTMYKYIGNKNTIGFAINSSNQIGSAILNVAR
jgi:hypothetical protein